MAKRTIKAFPRILHVTIDRPDNDDDWFMVREDGPLSMDDEDGTRVAIYRLVEVGELEVRKRYVSKKKAGTERAVR